ncbi:MAG TPA: GNAT family protein [Ktedonobacterales bacterium]|nr:GNAT family protein [Ktedonobacterales bacterium]
MRFELRPLRWREARQITRWRYPAPYAVYDLNTADMILALYLHPLWRLLGVANFCAVRDEHGELVGMFQYMRHGDALEIGLALRPDLTGKGLGLEFVRAGLAYGAGRFEPAAFRLDVAAFNERARRVYERAGFRAVRVVPKPVGKRKLDTLEMVRVAVSGGAAPGDASGVGHAKAGHRGDGRLQR